MQILVSGGAGFIGSNMCDALLALHHKVICLDNFLTGKKSNVSEALNHPNFSLIEGDIRDLQTCELAVKDCDLVLHLAALGSVPRSINDPITTNDINIKGFLNMLTATKNAGIKRFVFASSSSTYGDSATLPKIEHQIGRPLSPYAVTKYVGELYADVFAKNYGIEFIGLRYFNVFGRRQDPQGAYAAVIPKFISQLLNHEAPIINGDGSFSRDFTYIDNVVEINIQALLTQNKSAINEIYNVACGEATSLNSLFTMLRDELAMLAPSVKAIEPIFEKIRVGDIPHSLASIEKAQRLLAYQPTTNVEEGIKQTVAWYVKDSKK
jgi:UDP-N-acetylglucosamine/UDP-N-acetylgalactosamine 4-epimerase